MPGNLARARGKGKAVSGTMDSQPNMCILTAMGTWLAGNISCSVGAAALSVLLALPLPGSAWADGLLDGRVFQGMIGPVEDPDLADRLYFHNGHFWSDICTRCGFQPGKYSSKTTDEGIVFEGLLESDSRGRFEYEGLVRDDGTINVSIQWERERWYWTYSREIVFRGRASASEEPMTLDAVREKMSGLDPTAEPRCARF